MDKRWDSSPADSMPEKQNTIQEMEQIQKGLEAFLEQEIKGMQGENPMSSETYREQAYPRPESAMHREQQDTEPEEYFVDWDSPAYRQRTTLSKEEKRSAGAASGRPDKRQKTAQGQAETGEQKMAKRRKRRRKARLKKGLLTIVVILAILAAGLYFLVGSFYERLQYVPIADLQTESMKEDGVIHILLIGSDARGEEKGRSDAMILLSLSNKTKKIYMTSLLRDMYVEIPGYKNNRLNAAYSYGGAELLLKTIEQNFDIEVNRYVVVNFEAFAKLVDAVGGVELELTSQEIEYVNGYLVEYNILYGRAEGTDYMDTSLSGRVHLNGPQALAYTRNRYLGTDFGRTQRQRKVLEEIIKKAPSALLTNGKELLQSFLPELTTNLTQKECYLLSLQAPKLVTYDIVQNSIPAEGTYQNATIREMSVLQVDFDANKKILRENIYGEVAD